MDDDCILESGAKELHFLISRLRNVGSLPPLGMARLDAAMKTLQGGAAELEELAVIARLHLSFSGDTGAVSNLDGYIAAVDELSDDISS